MSQVFEAYCAEDDKDIQKAVSRRYKRLGLSVWQGQKLLERLLEQGLIEQHQETTKTGRLKAIRLTAKGQPSTRFE